MFKMLYRCTDNPTKMMSEPMMAETTMEIETRLAHLIESGSSNFTRSAPASDIHNEIIYLQAELYRRKGLA